MRISDWSSDVCSSDLVPDVLVLPRATSVRRHGHPGPVRTGATIRVDGPVAPEVAGMVATHLSRAIRPLEAISVIQEDPEVPLSLPMRKRTGDPVPRSDERRGGKDCVGTCRSRWAP